MLFEEEFDLILDATKLELIKTRVFPPQKVKKRHEKFNESVDRILASIKENKK